jgi:Uma2 family endonuclease
MGKTISPSLEAADSLVLRNVTWDFYGMFIEGLGERPSRVSYDGSTLEMLMTLSFEHEGLKMFVDRVISTGALAARIDVVCGGSTTLKHHKRRQGLEPDQCYWVQNAAKVRGLKRLDLKKSPPPDLVIEVDVTHSAVDRESIYAAMGVPEMWHYARSSGLTGWSNVDGEWQRLERSLAFPILRLADVDGLVKRYVKGDVETKLLIEATQLFAGKRGRKSR